MRNRELNQDQNLIGGQMAVQNWMKINVCLNHFGAMQFTPELGSNSDLAQVQSWTTLVQRALNANPSQIYRSHNRDAGILP